METSFPWSHLSKALLLYLFLTGSLLISLLHFFFFCCRIDDIKLESFEGLEAIPKNISQQGTQSIAQYIITNRGARYVSYLKSNKDLQSLK